VNLDFSAEQQALREMLRDFFAKESPGSVARAAEPLGFDASLWRKVAGLGLAAIAVPEDRGGGGFGFVELAIAAELLGRFLAPVPLTEAAVACGLLVSLGGSAVVESLVAGERVATVALHPVALHPVAGRPAAGGVARPTTRPRWTAPACSPTRRRGRTTRDGRGAADLATMSFLFAAETAFTTASESLHFHDGYGYTLEYDIQLYFRRAKAWPLVAGDRRAGYAELARRLYGSLDGSPRGSAEG
jgi:alkylation response protein AidB-like acyl-CoA dehydrogenase